MRRHATAQRRRLSLAAIATVLSVTAACGGGAGGTDTGGAGRTEGTRGGTLTILQAADFEHLDPARNYTTWGGNFSRLIYRTLTTYRTGSNEATREVAPDLATDLGEASDDKTVWTFRLKDGLKYEDGSPIRSKDVKYGVERTFSEEFPDGAGYARQWLACPGYQGPYRDPAGCKAIRTPDDRTIVFRLNTPVPDFRYVVAMAGFAPVPASRDTRARYDSRPFSSGPYKIETYQRGKQLTLVRNPHWDPRSDQVRTALPDRFHVVMGVDPKVIDQRLIADVGPDRSAIQQDQGIQPESVARVVGSPAVRARASDELSGCIRYLAMDTTRPPFDDLRVRQAMEYAVNKEAFRTARGGPSAGNYATTLLVPTLAEYEKFDLYPAPPQGDPARAQELLSQAGLGNGFRTSLTTTAQGKGIPMAEAIQAGLARVKVTVDITAVDQSVYSAAVGDPSRQSPLVFYGFCPDWPSGSTLLPILFWGKMIQKQGNQNVARLDDPQLNALFARLERTSDKAQSTALLRQADRRILSLAAAVPLLYDKTIVLRGSNVAASNVHLGFQAGWDLVSIGLKSPSP